ncbi:MAG TPA: FHA domain-containing protein [Candidatus Baltobacteraceae bacterium]
MNDAGLRVGSIEVLAALAVFALVAVRPRVRRSRDVGAFTPVRIALDIRHGETSRRYEGLCPLVVGRSSAADVVVMDGEVSRRHARFETQNGVVYVSDAGSSNGTFLNGRRLDGAVEVRPNDAIDLGATRIVYIGKIAWA